MFRFALMFVEKDNLILFIYVSVCVYICHQRLKFWLDSPFSSLGFKCDINFKF